MSLGKDKPQEATSPAPPLKQAEQAKEAAKPQDRSKSEPPKEVAPLNKTQQALEEKPQETAAQDTQLQAQQKEEERAAAAARNVGGFGGLGAGGDDDADAEGDASESEDDEDGEESGDAPAAPLEK